MQEIQYTRHGDYFLPNFLPPQEETCPIGKYGRMRLSYLKEHRRILYTNLLTSGKLNAHLAEIEVAARNRMELLVRQMAETQNITEELKASNQMEWVGRMNNIRNAAEEIIRSELIYQ